MKKKILKMTMLLVIVLSLTGCWDYVGLNEITIITGIAIDKDPKTNKYDLTFEFVDLGGSAKDKTVSTKMIETTGTTIFDAVRNAKKRVMNKLYFSNAEVIIISKDIAKSIGIKSVINWFVRDAELRETINLIISDEKKAKDVLEGCVVDGTSTAFEVKKIVESDNIVTSSTKSVELYKAYNAIESKTQALVLPLFSKVKNDNKEAVEATGLAVFKKDKQIGDLNAVESKYYLFINNSIKGGILPLKYDSKNDTSNNVSLEISNSTTTKSFSYKDGKIKLFILTNTEVFLGEFDEQDHSLDETDIGKIEKEAEKMLKKNMLKVIEKSKKKFKHDIFGFSNIVYEHDPKLWNKINKNWDKLFMKADIEVISKVNITNSALLK